MKFIDQGAAKAWLEERGLLRDDGSIRQSNEEVTRRFSYSRDCGRRLIEARALVDFFDREGEALLYATETCLAPVGEDQNLLKRLRQALGETAGFEEKPGHLFSRNDLADITSLLTLFMFFELGCWLIAADLSARVEVTSDTVVDVYTEPTLEMLALLDELDELLGT